MSKTTKKLFTVVLCLLLSCIFACTAFADVIFEPEDDFYESNRDECTLIKASYTVIQDASAYKSPDNRKVTAELKKGDSVNVDVIYTDKSNVTWGFIEKYDSESRWIPMGYLAKQYNADDFLKEFSGSITANSSDIKLSGYEIIKMWNYPGEKGEGWEVNLFDDGNDPGSSIEETFIDDAGETWGHIGYYYGNRGWVCISDPQKAKTENVLKREDVVEYPDSLIENTKNTGSGALVIAGILVVMVVAVSAVLLSSANKKNKVK